MTVIAIDGTFASGKGTLGKRLASHYKMPYLDTGKALQSSSI
jgi:cytidylate kinase